MDLRYGHDGNYCLQIESNTQSPAPPQTFIVHVVDSEQTDGQETADFKNSLKSMSFRIEPGGTVTEAESPAASLRPAKHDQTAFDVSPRKTE